MAPAPCRSSSMTSLLPPLRAWCGARGGVAALELALIAPVLVLVTLGTYEASRIVTAYQVLSSAAGEAVRHAARLSNPCADGGFSDDEETSVAWRAERTADGTARLAGISTEIRVTCVDRDDAGLAGRYETVSRVGVITVEVTATVRPVLGDLFLDAEGLTLTTRQQQAWIG